MWFVSDIYLLFTYKQTKSCAKDTYHISEYTCVVSNQISHLWIYMYHTIYHILWILNNGYYATYHRRDIIIILFFFLVEMRIWCINIESSMVCDVIWFLSNELCVFYPPSIGEGIVNKQRIGHHKTWEIFITYLPPHTCFLLTLFFGGRGEGIHNVMKKNNNMSDITLISMKICDKNRYRMSI
jgi:hypothetical protein